jgi:biotin/methionine sulfoxide reductase
VSWSLQRAHHGEQRSGRHSGSHRSSVRSDCRAGGVGYGYASSAASVRLSISVSSPGISQLTRPIDSFIPWRASATCCSIPVTEFTYEGETRTYPDIKLVYWAGGNPYHHHQDLNRLSEAWTRPETIIVQDPMFTATAQRADIVLPANHIDRT